jgi:hypothetical protein
VAVSFVSGGFVAIAYVALALMRDPAPVAA